MPHFSTNGAQLHYRVYGEGPALLLIHGLGSSGADWAFQIADLAEHYRVIVPDLRGSGLSSKPSGPYAMDQFADDLWALLDHLGEPTTHLVGFSLGGAIALEMTLVAPHRSRRLVMINALPSYRVDHWRKWMEAHGQIALVRWLGLRRTARLLGRRLFPDPHQRAMRERVEAVISENPRRPYIDTVRALIGWCAADRVRQMNTPTLMLSAEHDYTDLAEKRRWSEHMGARFLVVRGSRHGTPFDSIVATNACLLAFLADIELPEDSALVRDRPDQTPSQPPMLPN